MSWPSNWGQRSLKVIESGIIRYIVYSFLLVFFNNIVPKMHRFSNIRLQKCRDLENQVRGPSRPLGMSPFDRAHYDFLLKFYINYGSISCHFWDIQCLEMSWPWNRGQRSLKVIENGTIR